LLRSPKKVALRIARGTHEVRKRGEMKSGASTGFGKSKDEAKPGPNTIKEMTGTFRAQGREHSQQEHSIERRVVG
jgi:hypothetical protein